MPHQEGLVLKSAQLHIYESLYRKKERLHCTGFRETSHATTGHVPYKLGIAIMCLHIGPQTHSKLLKFTNVLLVCLIYDFSLNSVEISAI